MTKNEEVFLGLSYWVASLDGNFDISEKEFIEKSDSFKSFYTADNFEYCKKNVIESSKNKDTKQFISEYLDGLNLSKEESKKLVIDLCEIGASDGDFDDIEKKYIGFVIEALGLENEKIIESFEKPKKNKNLVKDTSINSLDVPRSLLFAKKEEELIPVVKQKIQNHIEKKLSIKGFDLSISDLKINKTKKLSTRVLYDNREIEEDLEINYSGAIESRTVSKSSINLFESNCSGNPPIRQDYEFKNLSKVKKFRVDGTNERVTCSKCSGLRKVTCYGCSGAGKNRCSGCNGRGDNDCSNCTGGERHCYSCGGDGRTSSYDYDLQRDVSKTCSSCAGRGRNPCGTCGRTGRVRCSTCSGTGQVTCYTCSGRGEIPCSRCDAQGSFTYFLRISSKLLKKENSSFIDGEPDKQYITKNLGTEEFEYSKLFGKYELSKLKEHAPELKNLFKVIKFDSAQKPKKIRFDLEDCASMSFVVTVAGNVYVGGLNNEGKLYFDETILDQLFFNIIKTLDVDNSFKSIESIKSPVLAQIPNFNETYEKIGEYKTLRKIVESTQKNEVKLNKVRKLKNIDTSIYGSYLIKSIKASVRKRILTLLAIPLLIFCFLFPPWQFLLLFGFIVSLYSSSISTTRQLKVVTNDATKINSKSIRLALILNTFFLSIILVINGIVSKGFTNTYGANYEEIIWKTFLNRQVGFLNDGTRCINENNYYPGCVSYYLPFFDPLKISEFGLGILNQNPEEMTKKLTENILESISDFKINFTFTSCNDCDDDGVRSGSSYSIRRSNSGQDGEYGWGTPDTWNNKSLEQRSMYEIPQYIWKYKGKQIDEKAIKLIDKKTFDSFKSQFVIVHKDEIIKKSKIYYDNYETSFSSEARKYAIENILTDSLIIIKPSNVKVEYFYVDKGTSWWCLKCSGYVCSKCTNTTGSNRSGTTKEKIYLRLSNSKYNSLNPREYTYGWDDYSVGSVGDNFFSALEVGRGFVNQMSPYQFSSAYAGTSYGGDKEDWNSLRGREVRSYQDSEEVNRFNFVFPSKKIKKDNATDYGIYIMQNDINTFKRMLLSSAVLPDPSKNPRTRNDGKDFFNVNFYLNIKQNAEEKVGTIQKNYKYDFYHLLVSEKTFKSLFKSSSKKHIDSSKVYVVQ